MRLYGLKSVLGLRMPKTASTSAVKSHAFSVVQKPAAGNSVREEQTALPTVLETIPPGSAVAAIRNDIEPTQCATTSTFSLPVCRQTNLSAAGQSSRAILSRVNCRFVAFRTVDAR